MQQKDLFAVNAVTQWRKFGQRLLFNLKEGVGADNE